MGEAPAVADPRTGRARPATFRDQVLATRVCTTVAPDCINSLVTPGDVPAELHPLYSFLAIAAETDKPVGGPGQDHAWQTPVLFEMASAVLSAPGPAESRPASVVLDMGYSPVSPLHLGVGVCDGIVAAARLGMAVQVLTNPVAGTTAPASVAGALAQQDAEILAGVVLAQAAAPGAACGYGARALRRRPARRPPAVRRRPVGARFRGRDAAGARARPRL